MNIEFKNTQEAIAYGKKATPTQIKELKRLRIASKGKCRVEQRKGNTNAALAIAFQAQFYREALEAATGTHSLTSVS